MIWLTSDLHFNHANIIRYSNRPFSSVTDMNDSLIRAWNERIAPGDEVWVLGDFGFYRPSNEMTLESIFRSLKGNKHLVIGNHDKRNKRVLQLPWASQHKLHTIHYNDTHIVACHYPLETWEQAQHGYLHAHGHSHGSMKRIIPHRWDIGVDPMGYKPIPITDIIEWGAAQTFDAQDHHGD